MSDPSSVTSAAHLHPPDGGRISTNSASTSTSSSSSNSNPSTARAFHSRLSSLDETRKSTWTAAEIENFDELDALEDRIRSSDLLKDHNMDKSPQCPKTINGGQLVSWFLAQKLAKDRTAALALGQRLVDAHKMFHVEPRTNRRLHQDFEGHSDSLWRFEVDRSCGADPVRAYSLTKFYFAKINSHSGHLHLVGLHRLTPFFGVLSREDSTIYMFRNQEAGKPYDDVYLKRAAYFIADSMETPSSEKKNKDDGRRGSYIGIISSGRNVLLACPSSHSRDQWVAELDKVHMKLVEPPPKVSADIVAHLPYDSNMFPPHTPKTPLGSARNLSFISEAPTTQLIDKLLHETERVRVTDGPASPRAAGLASVSTTGSTSSLHAPASSGGGGGGGGGSTSTSTSTTTSTPSSSLNSRPASAGSKDHSGAGAGFAAGSNHNGTTFTPRSSDSAVAAAASGSNFAAAALAAAASASSNNSQNAYQVDGKSSDSNSEASKTVRAAAEAKRQLSLMTPFLGFSFDAVEENDNPFDGLLVDVVEADTPAERAGLRRGDVVLQVNGMRTLTLPDLKHAIRNQYPGACLDVFGERDSKPLHLAMIIGAKGIPDEHIAQLRAIIEEAEKYSQQTPLASLASKNLEEDESSVTLADVLETPQWRLVLLSYMEANLCAESLNFLTAEQAYQRIPDSQSERRGYAARLICDEFIDERGDQMVNLDNDTRKTVMAKIAAQEYAPMLFHEAAKVVYKMVETDVFRRFIHTDEYKEMLSDPFINQSESLQKHRRKANSFVVIALEERTSELDLIASEFTKTGIVQDRRYHLKKYKSCFTGSQLVDFLIEQGYCKNRPAGVAVGQRMHDANILRHVNDECEFEDSDKFFTFLRSSVSEGPSVIQLFQKARSQNGTLHSGYLLLKGVHYNRVYCVLFKEKKKLYIYRTHTSPAPNIKLRLKGATYKSYSDSKSVATSSATLGVNGTLTSAVDDVPTEVDKFYKLARGRSAPGSGSGGSGSGGSGTSGSGSNGGGGGASGGSASTSASASGAGAGAVAGSAPTVGSGLGAGSGFSSGSGSGVRREPITYLQIETQTKSCTFRIEGTADAEAWQQGIQKAGCVLQKD